MIQFWKVRNYLNQNSESLIPQWFPNDYKVNNDIYKTGDFNDIKPKVNDGSLVIDLIKKKTIDFATREIAGDIISIYMHIVSAMVIKTSIRWINRKIVIY